MERHPNGTELMAHRKASEMREHHFGPTSSEISFHHHSF